MNTRLICRSLGVLTVVGTLTWGSGCAETAKSAQRGVGAPPGKEAALVATHDSGMAKDSGKPNVAQANADKLNAVNVRITPVKLSNITEHITVSGQTLADARVTYSAEVAGRVESMPVELGDRVKRGQVLARVNYELLKAQADAARAGFELAEKTHKRLAALRDQRLVSVQQFDEAHAQMVQAEAQMRIAEANLEKSTVRATRNGTITKKACEVGSFVAPGAPLYELVDYRTIQVQAQLPERLATRVRSGAPVKVRFDALNREVDGVVDVVVPASTSVAKTFELRVEVDNRDYAILVGMAATVRIVAAKHADAVVAPQDVVIEEARQRSVFIEQDGVAHKRQVVLGAAVDGKVVVEEGLTAGERLVVVGQRDLVHGQPVRVIQ